MGLFNNNKTADNSNVRRGSGLRQMYKSAKPALNLSAEQETKIEGILSQLKEDRQNIKSNGEEDNKDELRSARQQARQQVMEILNPEQKKTWQQTVNTWREQSEGPLK